MALTRQAGKETPYMLQEIGQELNTVELGYNVKKGTE
jgi:hypothetical protein